MSREETRKHLCTKHRNNPARNDGKGKEILYVPRGREVNADANPQGQSHLCPWHSHGRLHATGQTCKHLVRTPLLRTSRTLGSNKSVLHKTAGKQPA